MARAVGRPLRSHFGRVEELRRYWAANMLLRPIANPVGPGSQREKATLLNLITRRRRPGLWR